MIKLYHYSKEKINILKTLEKQNRITKEDIKKANTKSQSIERPGYYYQHISFFLIPVDVNNIGKIYGSEHPVWYTGNKLFEHVISLDNLDNFKYEIFYDKYKLTDTIDLREDRDE